MESSDTDNNQESPDEMTLAETDRYARVANRFRITNLRKEDAWSSQAGVRLSNVFYCLVLGLMLSEDNSFGIMDVAYLVEVSFCL